MKLQDGETIVKSYPIWTLTHQMYINSCISLGYDDDDIKKFTDELKRLDPDRVEDFHNYINNRKNRRTS